MKKKFEEYSKVIKHLEHRNYDIMKIPEDMLFPYLKENDFNAVYDSITTKNQQGLDVIDRWKLTQLHNDWIDLNVKQK
jgi:L-rhamnose mutarotase